MINKPIVSNSIPIGVVTEAELDKTGLWIKCKGIIFDRFAIVEYSSVDNNTLEFESIVIK